MATSMQSRNDNDIDTLNDLIETTLDSVRGYEEAAREADPSQFQSIFETRAQQRREIATRLQEQVRALGGTPEDSGSMLAAAHRLFLDMKSAISRGDQAVIEEVERGEDIIKAEFEKASADADLTPETRRVITNALEQIRDAHAQMSEIKHTRGGGPSQYAGTR